MSIEKLVKSPERRVKRNPLEGRNKLKVKGKDEVNFHYRIVNDTEDRIQDYKDMGYEPDLSEGIRVGDSRVDSNSRLGSVRQISVGGGTKAVLMKIRRDWYEEDQAEKQKYVDKTEEAMKPNHKDGTYGKIEITRK